MFITIAKSNDPTKFVRTKIKVQRKSAVAINLNRVQSISGGIDREEEGVEQAGRTLSSHFVSVLFKFHQLFGV